VILPFYYDHTNTGHLGLNSQLRSKPLNERYGLIKTVIRGMSPDAILSQHRILMTGPSQSPQPVHFVTGTQGSYHWLSISGHSIDDLLRVSPATVLGKYLAVTSCDSGPLPLTEEQKSCGWVYRGGIAYSPRVESLDMVPVHDIYDEWYVFKAPADLGAIRNGNIFEFPVSPEHLEVFVNFGFVMDAPEMRDLVSRFWQQLEWIRPEAYIAESDCGFLTLVTGDSGLFAAVCNAFTDSHPIEGNVLRKDC
jgi:hypothetical protein